MSLREREQLVYINLLSSTRELSLHNNCTSESLSIFTAVICYFNTTDSCFLLLHQLPLLSGLLSSKVYGQFLLSFLSYFFYPRDCIHGIQEDVSVSDFITSPTFIPLNRLDHQFDPTIASISAEGRFVNVSGQSPDILRAYKQTI